MVKSGECFNSQNMSYTCWGIDDRKQPWNQSTVTLFNQNLFIYNPVFYLLNGPDPWKLVDLLVLYYVQYELNKRLPLVLCEIIERREGEVIIQYASMNDGFDCHCVCMKECEIPSYVAYSDHFFAFKFWLLTLKMMHGFFRGCRFISWVLFWQCLLDCNHIW